MAAIESALMKCAFSIDVEDWFHILDLPSAPPPSEWDNLPSRVERNLLRLLDLLDHQEARATCFFLGWVAERFPSLVREASRRGHEIASHGYSHELVFRMTRESFFRDAEKSRKLLEDISGLPVRGFRATGFSATSATPWFFESVARAGYDYDSSVFPARRAHGGLSTECLGPCLVKTDAGDLVEFPITVTSLLGYRVCLFGGGYLRLFPYRLVARMSRRILDKGHPVNFYVHPREIDPEHPRLPMNPLRKFKSYVNLRTTERKVMRILEDFDVTTFRDCLDQMPQTMEVM